MLGYCAMCFACRVGELSVGDVVLFLALMGQLMGPLNFFGSYYRILQQVIQEEGGELVGMVCMCFKGVVEGPPCPTATPGSTPTTLVESALDKVPSGTAHITFGGGGERTVILHPLCSSIELHLPTPTLCSSHACCANRAQYMIDMENLFGLLSKTPAVKGETRAECGRMGGGVQGVLVAPCPPGC